MKILFIAADLSQIGGIQEYVKTFRETINNFGVQTVLVERKPGKFMVKVYCAIHFFYTILINKPDFIICTHINFGILSYIAKKVFGIRYSLTLYGIDSLNLNNYKILFIKNADIVMAAFPWTLRNIESQVPSKRKQCMLFPATFDADRFYIDDKPKELLEKFNFRGSKIVLTICRISKQDGDNKGYRRVIQAMNLVIKKVPTAKYVLVGDGDDIEGARKLSLELGLKNYVFFVGAVLQNDMVRYYNLADVFVLPSKNEGFPPIVLLESLACGIPVVGGNQNGSDVFPWDGDVALIAEADNIQSIADKIITLLTFKAAKKFHDRSFLRETILKLYGPDAHRIRIQELLNTIRKTIPG